ncbi:F-box/kelch-repeat protein At5g60570-like [Cryptomeria japonica]|uniref:F-box/kelch-repeat protein At5g60570-like n=1 Tax=Cryptomeria japonica TaxID=3369 RepID=UPI0027DA5F1E|nr:F-box/kelch-repeat protein At5g60570-like [Cryptomeria japonica]
MDESLVSALLPSLPDEIAWRCLARLPRRSRAIASCVSRAWANACKNKSFIRYLRRSLNLPTEYCTFIAVFDSRFDGDYVHATQHNTKWLLVDPLSLGAQVLPNPLSAISVEMDFCSAATNDQIFLPQVNQTKEGFCSYEIGVGRWKSVELPPGKRCRRFCCAEMKEFVYLCGGLINFTGEASKSAFRYHNRNNQWEKLPDMIAPRINCAGVSMNDTFYAIGGYCHSHEGFPQTHASAERFDPTTGQWTLLPNFCAEGLRYAEDSAIAESDFAVVENKRLFAVQAQSNEVMELDGVKEDWRHVGYIGGVCEMRDCGTNYKILGVGSELWAIQYRVGKSIKIYSCKPGELESLIWRQIDVRGLESFDHVLTGTTFQV